MSYIEDLLDILTATTPERGPKLIHGVAPEDRIKRSTLHNWSHFICNAVSENMGLMMAETNLPELLFTEQTLTSGVPVKIQVACFGDDGFEVRGIQNVTGDVETDNANTVFTMRLTFTPQH
jgi:hypothetical protein